MNRHRAVLVVLLFVAAALAYALVRPFLQYVLLAVLLAYLLYPVQRRLAPRVGSRVAAATLITVTVGLLLLPVAVLLGVAAQQALGIVELLRTGAANYEGLERFLRTTFGVAVELDALLPTIPERLGEMVNRNGSEGTQRVLAEALNVVTTVTNLGIGLFVTLFLLYYLLVDGADVVGWVRRVLPLSPSVQRDLLGECDRLMWAAVVGNVVVALVQGLLTGIGFYAVGFSDVVFWTVVTFGLSLLPLIGASVVWLPASLYLVVTGQPVPGAALFAYGALVVSLSDNYLRPVVGGREANLNPGLFLLGIFGGLALLGVMGLFFGPVLLGMAKRIAEVTARELAEDSSIAR
ncbi:AI-2E family transporter [Halomarina ordinaria]|uniref:AI-2E family transporter n=1 Tax=Halomarina ordinaria TaxID=3033939 RepID=A0ABD5U3M8_9EURY|nr:AI-2E family transporter [Halomarina sp. PSRA2]